ncbi:MAG: hypothetical protein V3U84_11675, partial [Thiotrichaceae bacterium]
KFKKHEDAFEKWVGDRWGSEEKDITSQKPKGMGYKEYANEVDKMMEELGIKNTKASVTKRPGGEGEPNWVREVKLKSRKEPQGKRPGTDDEKYLR